MQAAEAAVAHDEHVIAAAHRAGQVARQGIDLATYLAAGAELAGDRLHVPAQIGGRVQPHLVGAGERRRERVAVHPHAHGVRARLEHGDDARRAHAAAQAINGGGDGGRVVREVIVDAYAARLARQLHAPRDALEFLQCRQRPRHRHAGMARRGDGGERVLHVVGTDQLPLHLALGDTALEHLEARVVAAALRRPERLRLRGTRETLERCPAPHGERFAQRRIGGVPDDAPAAGHDAYQVMELALDRGEVRVDVGVVELEVVEDQRCAAGSARTWRACRRTPCRTRRPR